MKHAEIARYFLKLGFLGFGGPLALMVAFQRDLVGPGRWMSLERFSQALALIKALPGPTATQLAIYLGFIRGGRIGGALAGICLIAPAFFMMVGLAAFYASVESFAWSKPILFGMQAAALGVILDGLWRLAQPLVRERSFWVTTLSAALITLYKPSLEPIAIVGSGLFGVWFLAYQTTRKDKVGKLFSLGSTLTAITGSGVSDAQAKNLAVAAAATTATATAAAASPGISILLGQLAAVGLKAGLFVFGTGLAIVPLLAHDVVEQHKWLTHAQFMDALAFGQITPGPVVITMTFIGYKVAGLAGAIVATISIFAPAFFNILTWFPIAEKKLAGSPYARSFSIFALGAVVGSIFIAVIRLASNVSHGTTHPEAWVLAGLAFLIALKTKVPVWITIPLGGLVGFVSM
ncbi:MAG: chromate efflux transporter [Bdellovibrionota bacterium]